MQNNSKLNLVLLIIILALSVYTLFSQKRNESILMNILEQQIQDYQPRNKEINTRINNSADLVSFSVQPNQKVSGKTEIIGQIKGGYFFEANILINVLDSNKKLLKASHASATDEWMTAGPVAFAGNIDLSGLPKGPAYLEIHNDNPSGLPEYDKSILIPIVIE